MSDLETPTSPDRPQYTMWSVFSHTPGTLPPHREAAGAELAELLDRLTQTGITVRGLYHVGGLSADADWMIWWHADSLSALQESYQQLRRTMVGQVARPVWSAAGTHRPAEFNRDHAPAYLSGREPERYLAVYPFVRSSDWYLLDPDERRALLVEHGRASHDFPDVLSNTVAAFGLGDYEWVIALEAATPTRLVDLMRAFRYTGARRHVRLETPFFTGERSDPASLLAVLP